MAGKRSRKKVSGSSIDVDAPVRPYGEGLTKTLSFRVTDAEADRFQQRCDESGWSRADLFRAAFMGTETRLVYKPVNPRTLPDYRAAAYQIKKAGNNLNQIAHALNKAAKQGNVDDRLATAALVQLRAIQKEFIARIDVEQESGKG